MSDSATPAARIVGQTPGAAAVLPWLAVGVLLAWLYGPLTASMVKNWWVDPNYSHGFLVPLVAAYLLWRQRAQLKAAAAGPNPAGLAVVAAGLLMLLAGQLGHEFFLRRLSLIPVLWGLTLLAWGWPVARRTAFALGYLVLMVPLPYVLYDSAAFPLRLLAASLAGGMIRLFGVPVLVEGNVLSLPHVVLDVVDACSGIRSLISLLAAGVILAYLMLPRRWLKFLVVAMVLPTAVFTNAVRVAVAGLLAERWGESMLEGAMHDMVGWVVFMSAFGLLWAFTALLGALGGGKGGSHEPPA
jgi:exosortase